jgi:hypothetical protein
VSEQPSHQDTPAADADATEVPPTATGVAAADDAARRLAEIADAPVDAHVGIYEDVHRRLQEGLADLDEQ